MKFTLILLVFLTSLPGIGYTQTKEELHTSAINARDNKNLVKALELIDKALTKDPKNETFLLFKGNTLDEAKQHQAAYETYTLLIELNPTNPIPYNQRALLLQSIQEFDLSIQDYTNALKLESSDSVKLTLYLNRGVARISIRDFQGGYDDYMKAYSYDSLNIALLNNIATICDEVGKGDQTLTYLNKII